MIGDDLRHAVVDGKRLRLKLSLIRAMLNFAIASEYVDVYSNYSIDADCGLEGPLVSLQATALCAVTLT
jgi:hypothetical protein